MTQAVISGSYRKFPEALRRDLQVFASAGVMVRSPPSAVVLRVLDGFAALMGDPIEGLERLPPAALRAAFRILEDGHLRAICEADLLWLTTENGYFGRSTLFEVGYAHRHGVPVYARRVEVERSKEPIVLAYVQGVEGPLQALAVADRRMAFADRPREDPAVAVGAVIVQDDQVLLVRNGDWGGRYTLVGGRLFADEDLVGKTMALVRQQAGVEGQIGRPVYANSMLPGSGYVDPTARRQYVDHLFRATTSGSRSGCTWRRWSDVLSARDVEPNALAALRAAAGVSTT